LNHIPQWLGTATIVAAFTALLLGLVLAHLRNER
jgi:hypothetical protein